jgi:hypothetical protein
LGICGILIFFLLEINFFLPNKNLFSAFPLTFQVHLLVLHVCCHDFHVPHHIHRHPAVIRYCV